MKIIKLEAENVKRIRAVEITPDGSMVMIGGDNAQGKSSVLDSIMVALGGKKYESLQMVHDGKKKGFIDLDFGKIKVRRTFTVSGGGILTVTDADGHKMASPQTVLDSLIGAVSFDPLSFAGSTDGQQGEIIKDLAGIDLSELDANRKEYYDERTLVNRETKKYETALAEMAEPAEHELDEKYLKPLTTTDVLKEIADNDEVKKGHVAEYEWSEKLIKDIADADALVVFNKARISELEKEIDILKQRNKDAALATDANNKNLQESEKKQAEFSEKIIHPEVLKNKLQSIEDHNRVVRKNESYAAAEKKVADSVIEADNLTKKITDADTERDKTIKAASMPISGLSFNEDGILLYQNIPFSQASDAEKIRVSVAIGIAMNPKLKVLMIRNGSLLDEKNLSMIAKMAQLKNSQLWVETVGKREGCSVIMEDGFSKTPDSEDV
jgi:DNA repair exonuclease SbcCD ATPase subunit